jgi:hypothetical protein
MFSVHCLTKTIAVEICMKKSKCKTFTTKLRICLLFQINFLNQMLQKSFKL